MTKTTDKLNGNLYKESMEYYKTSWRKMVLALVKNCPKELLIQVLKEKKIIERDWLQKGETYIEKK